MESRTRKPKRSPVVAGRIVPEPKTTLRKVLAKGDGLFMVNFATGSVLTHGEWERRGKPVR